MREASSIAASLRGLLVQLKTHHSVLLTPRVAPFSSQATANALLSRKTQRSRCVSLFVKGKGPTNTDRQAAGAPCALRGIICHASATLINDKFNLSYALGVALARLFKREQNKNTFQSNILPQIVLRDSSVWVGGW